jgi:hypothetical protein
LPAPLNTTPSPTTFLMTAQGFIHFRSKLCYIINCSIRLNNEPNQRPSRGVPRAAPGRCQRKYQASFPLQEPSMGEKT